MCAPHPPPLTNLKIESAVRFQCRMSTSWCKFLPTFLINWFLFIYLFYFLFLSNLILPSLFLSFSGVWPFSSPLDVWGLKFTQMLQLRVAHNCCVSWTTRVTIQVGFSLVPALEVASVSQRAFLFYFFNFCLTVWSRELPPWWKHLISFGITSDMYVWLTHCLWQVRA